MGFMDWLQGKSEIRSAENIRKALRSIVEAVASDWSYSVAQLEPLNRMHARLMAHGPLSSEEEGWIAEYNATRRTRKERVAAAQKELYTSITLWSCMPVQRALSEVVIPSLEDGSLVRRDDPVQQLCMVAAYRVCAFAAREQGLDLGSSTPAHIQQLMAESGDVYA